MTIEVRCDLCGAKLQAKPEHAGKQTKCPKCGGKIRIPSPPPELDVSQRASALEEPLPGSGSGVSRPDTPMERPSATAAPSGSSCPSCGSELEPNAVICVRCGMDLRSGKRLVTRRPAEHSGASRKAGLARRWGPLIQSCASSPRFWAILIVGGAVFIVLLLPAIWAARDLSRRASWNAEGPWTTYTHPVLEWSVSFPGEPKTVDKPVAGQGGISGHVTGASFQPAFGIEYSVAVVKMDLPPGAALPAKLTGEQIAQGFASSDSDVRVLSAKDIRLDAFVDSWDSRGRIFGAYPGQEVEFEIPSSGLCGTGRMIVRRDSLYTVGWIGPSEKKSVSDVPRFLDSFEFLPRPDKASVANPRSEAFGGRTAMRVDVPGVPAIVSLPTTMLPVEIARTPALGKLPRADMPGLKATYFGQAGTPPHFCYCYVISVDPMPDAMGPVLKCIEACIEGGAKWEFKEVEAQGPDGKSLRLRTASATGKQTFHFIPATGASIAVDDTLPTSVMEGVLQVWDRSIEKDGSHLLIVLRVPTQFAGKEHFNCYEIGKAMAASATPK